MCDTLTKVPCKKKSQTWRYYSEIFPCIPRDLAISPASVDHVINRQCCAQSSLTNCNASSDTHGYLPINHLLCKKIWNCSHSSNGEYYLDLVNCYEVHRGSRNYFLFNDKNKRRQRPEDGLKERGQSRANARHDYDWCSNVLEEVDELVLRNNMSLSHHWQERRVFRNVFLLQLTGKKRSEIIRNHKVERKTWIQVGLAGLGELRDKESTESEKTETGNWFGIGAMGNVTGSKLEDCASVWQAPSWGQIKWILNGAYQPRLTTFFSKGSRRKKINCGISSTI